MKKMACILMILFFSLNIVITESIWDDKAKDLYNRKIYYNVGDSVQIIIEEASALEYRGTSKSLKNYTFNMSGGELSGLFTFIPKGDSEETKTSNEQDDLQINSVIQGRIVTVGDNFVTIQGRKQISVNNRSNVIEISGDAYFSDIISNKIYSTHLINPALTITTLVENVNEVLDKEDLVKVILNPDATSDIIEETRLSEEKKQELLLDYFNKILNVIF